jgi:Flp pilus assembly pilin Flp
MVERMMAKKFLKEDQGGPITTEYVIFVAAIGIIMGVGVVALFNGMSALFGAWSGYFGTSG